MKKKITTLIVAAAMAATSSLAHAVSLPTDQIAALDAIEEGQPVDVICRLHARAYLAYAYLHYDGDWSNREFRAAGDYLRGLDTHYGFKAYQLTMAAQYVDHRMSVPMQQMQIEQASVLIQDDCRANNAYQ